MITRVGNAVRLSVWIVHDINRTVDAVAFFRITSTERLMTRAPAAALNDGVLPSSEASQLVESANC